MIVGVASNMQKKSLKKNFNEKKKKEPKHSFIISVNGNILSKNATYRILKLDGPPIPKHHMI